MKPGTPVLFRQSPKTDKLYKGTIFRIHGDTAIIHDRGFRTYRRPLKEIEDAAK